MKKLKIVLFTIFLVIFLVYEPPISGQASDRPRVSMKGQKMESGLDTTLVKSFREMLIKDSLEDSVFRQKIMLLKKQQKIIRKQSDTLNLLTQTRSYQWDY